MDRKIKILFIIPELGTGGSERLVYDLCRLLNAEVFIPSVCAFHSGCYEQQLCDHGVKVYKLVGNERLSINRNIITKIVDFKKRIMALNAIILIFFL